jgi:hypothetical protein
MAALEAARPGGSRFVGGCVRNTLRGIPADDIDIATQILPEDVMKAMKAAGIRALPTGIEHGTVTAIIDGEPFEDHQPAPGCRNRWPARRGRFHGRLGRGCRAAGFPAQCHLCRSGWNPA